MITPYQFLAVKWPGDSIIIHVHLCMQL